MNTLLYNIKKIALKSILKALPLGGVGGGLLSLCGLIAGGCLIPLYAQTNIQLHYDFGKHIYNADEHNRQDVTITYEGFHADKAGSWYYFIDADLNKNGMQGAYTELSREFTFANTSSCSSLAAHAEIDAGLSKGAGMFQPALLIGPAWNWHSADFSKTLSLLLMYKQFTGQNWNISGDSGDNVKPYSSVQLTTVWGINLCHNKLRFAGFVDFWLGRKSSDWSSNIVILTEPQLWYNISNSCAIGTEWEMSSNFIYSSDNYQNDKFYFNPTLAFKYQF